MTLQLKTRKLGIHLVWMKLFILKILKLKKKTNTDILIFNFKYNL